MTYIFFNRLWLVCLCSLFAFKSPAQPYYNQRPEYIRANSQWACSSGGLNFNTVPATVTMFGAGYEGIASVADPVTGALLFYTDGSACWNATNALMLNGGSLLGNSGISGSSTTQGVCIVPFIDEPGKYYLFSLSGPTTWSGGPQPDTFLYYSVVDMSLDGGLGGIVPGQKNIPLGDNVPLSESMIAIPGNNCDIWLMVHDYINPVFKAFHITRQGVDPNPVVSAAGAQIQGNAGMGAYGAGGMAVSPDRKTIGITSCALATGSLPGATGTLLCKFNAGTGTVGSSVQVNQTGMSSYTLAFSPDNTKLYLCELMDSSVGLAAPNPIMQYGISIFDSAAIATSQVIVGHTFGDFNASGYFKSYDGKVYLLPFVGTDSLFVINQPNLSGPACNFQPYHCSNPGGLFFNGPTLSNDVVYAFPPDTGWARKDTLVCTRHHMFGSVAIAAPAGYDGYLWEDGSTAAVRNINAPGTYRVFCRDSCHSLLDSIVVTTHDIPLDLGPDTTICNQATLTLDATLPGANYLWQDGSTNSVFTTSGGGAFWLRLSAQGCIVSDTVVVKALDLRQELGKDIVLCKGDAVQAVTLEARVPDGASVEWSTGSQTPTILATDTGRYWVRVADLPCSGSDTIRIIPEVCACRVGIPNAFTPNNDGLNDEFLPVIESGCSVRNYVLNIYNRFGARIYSGYQPDKGWDGRDKGSLAEVGTYMYEITFLGGTREIKYYQKGDIILVR